MVEYHLCCLFNILVLNYYIKILNVVAIAKTFLDNEAIKGFLIL